MSIPEHLEATVRNLPALPGCYLFYDQRGEVIYVGKAVNLRSRVRSYFNLNTWVASPKTARLVKEIARIEVVVRGNELEALIQEAEREFGVAVARNGGLDGWDKALTKAGGSYSASE